MRKRLLMAVVIAAPLLLAGVYLWGPSETPAGQPPLSVLSASNFTEFQNAFDSADQPRIILLLSPHLSNMSAGGLRSRKVSCQPFGHEAPRSGRLGADLAHRFYFPKQQRPRQNRRPARHAVLGPKPSCRPRAESKSRRQATNDKACLLPEPGILLG